MKRVPYILTGYVVLVAALGLMAAGILPTRQPVPAPPSKHNERLPVIPELDVSRAELCAVVAVVDGDTITVSRNGVTETVRLLGVDTPETQDPRKEVQFFGKEASAFLSNLVTGEDVYLTFEKRGEKDRYGRSLAYVHRAPDGLWVNLEIVRQGYGQVYSGEAFQHIDVFLAYQRRAREAGKGLWNPALKAEWEQHQVPNQQPADARGPEAVAPRAVEPAAEPPERQKVTVYITKTGQKYHRASCSYLRKSSIPIDLREAKARYSPCSKCRPPTE